jgi:hypothetical protein
MAIEAVRRHQRLVIAFGEEVDLGPKELASVTVAKDALAETQKALDSALS